MAGASAAAPYHSTTSSHPAPSSTSSAGLPPVVQPNPRSGDMQLIQSLELAPTQRDRVNLLNQPGDFVFDFNNPPDAALTRGNGGWTVAATADTFPAVIGNGVGMTLGFIGPCGLNTPHVHNRGTEFNVIVQGRLVTNFQVENGVDARANILSRFQATVFPQGAIHTEFNPDCEDAVFVAGFNSVDPGVEQIAQTFFNLRPDIINTTLGGVAYVDGEDIDSIRAMLPANVALGVELCLNKCGKTKRAKRDLTEIFA
ncbi:RmlC-like cupin [Thozetella sp. PMI_491]|nr:RmlC-like cupin [Thozetella sp. PMI_491]